MKPDSRWTSDLTHDPVARGLGVASLLLGVPRIANPEGFARGLGFPPDTRPRRLTAAVGAREMTVATGLLVRPHPAWLWGRVGGDVMDLALLVRRLKAKGGRGTGRTIAATAATAALAAADLYAAVTRTRRSTSVALTATTTVNRPAGETFDFWRDLERLPRFMAHLDEVRYTGGRTSHWTAGAPFGRTVEWEAEITEEVPGQAVAWRSLPGGDIENSGEVRFLPAPGGRGTEVRVRLDYRIPGGALGKAVARWFGEDPHQQLDDDLRRFKQVMETGEVVRSDGAPGGKRARGEFPQHPAQPLDEGELKEALR